VLELRKADSGIIDPVDQQDVDRLLALISTDPDMALTKSRVILERLITYIFVTRVGPSGTRPLESLIRDAGKAGVLPRKVAALCDVVREMGNVGAHPILDDEKVTHREAQLATMALLLIFEWYNRELVKPVPPRVTLSPLYKQVRTRVLERVDCTKLGEVDEEGRRRVLRRLIEQVVDAESPLLTRIERESLIDHQLVEISSLIVPLEGPGISLKPAAEGS
jgi:hypothetical protein